jgi:hypothetical protein
LQRVGIISYSRRRASHDAEFKEYSNLEYFLNFRIRKLTMSIFGDIFHKIFPASHPAPTDTATEAPAAPEAAPVEPMEEVDVEAVLNNMAAENPEKLNWKTSIVDLMKLLKLDSSLEQRKALAKELDYTGDMGDSASMNIWLHKQVMNKLAANGGKVPADLKD